MKLVHAEKSHFKMIQKLFQVICSCQLQLDSRHYIDSINLLHSKEVLEVLICVHLHLVCYLLCHQVLDFQVSVINERYSSTIQLKILITLFYLWRSKSFFCHAFLYLRHGHGHERKSFCVIVSICFNFPWIWT